MYSSPSSISLSTKRAVDECTSRSKGMIVIERMVANLISVVGGGEEVIVSFFFFPLTVGDELPTKVRVKELRGYLNWWVSVKILLSVKKVIDL